MVIVDDMDGPLEPTETTSLLADHAFLSHMMLQVPNVQQTVKYWTEHQGGKAPITRPNEDGDGLASAFVELGHVGGGGKGGDAGKDGGGSHGGGGKSGHNGGDGGNDGDTGDENN